MLNWGQSVVKIYIDEWRSFKNFGSRFLNDHDYYFDCDFTELFESVSFGTDVVIIKCSFEKGLDDASNLVFKMVQNYINDMAEEDERYDYFGAATITDNFEEAWEIGGIDDAPFINMEIDHNTYDTMDCHDKLKIIID